MCLAFTQRDNEPDVKHSLMIISTPKIAESFLIKSALYRQELLIRIDRVRQYQISMKI
ncbi:hypothetical protein SeV_B1133 [Salmonella enterica subsp. enterica serovar Virchow str. SL491]|uniref:Uncharacterized protein n=1 Tax=Salmonella virchow (strain SL491) TaxID=465517 RepID=A0A6C8F205_SALV4|nr:hypothetical protein SeV_B1133 [Salmonella enterica subsp. enterica serovar Virchow str. SL491]